MSSRSSCMLWLYKTKNAPPQGRCCRYARVATPPKVLTAIALTFIPRGIHTHSHIYKYNCNVDANVGHKLQSAAIDKTRRGLQKIHFRGYARVIYYLLVESEGEGNAVWSSCMFVFILYTAIDNGYNNRAWIISAIAKR